MAIFSRTVVEKKLHTWLAAEEAVATGQSYQIGTRRLQRADLEDIQKEIDYWAGKLAEIEAEEKSGGRNKAYHFVPRDM